MAKYSFGKGIFVGILIALLGWSFYSILNQGSKDILIKIGIENFYAQNLVLIGVIVIILVVGFKKKKLIGRIIK